MKSALITLFCLFAMFECMAALPVRMDLVGRNAGISLEKFTASPNLKAGYAAFLKEDPETYLICYSVKPVTSEWTTYEVSFVPDDSGMVKMELLATGSSKVTSDRVLVDDIQVTGAELVNPSFETADGWKGKGIITADGVKGSRCASVTYRETLSQSFKVKEGEKVTIRFSAKNFVPAK